MFTANLAATAVGAGLLYVIYEFVLRDHRTDQYVEFHIRTSNYLGAIFTLCFAIIIIYEWPIRRYLGKLGSNASIPDYIVESEKISGCHGAGFKAGYPGEIRFTGERHLQR